MRVWMTLGICVAAGGFGPAAAGATRNAPRSSGAGAHVAQSPGKGTTLSPRLAALATASSFAGAPRASALSLPVSGVGSLAHRPDGKILVEIRTTDVGTATVARLRSDGAQVVDVSAEYSTVTAAVAASALGAIASDPAVRFVQEVLSPQVGSATTAEPSRRAAALATATPHAQCGSTTSEGDSLMRAATATLSR